MRVCACVCVGVGLIFFIVLLCFVSYVLFIVTCTHVSYMFGPQFLLRQVTSLRSSFDLLTFICPVRFLYLFRFIAKMAHKTSTCAFHRFLSSAAGRTSLQGCHPVLDLSFSTMRRQVVFGRPLFLLLSGVNVGAVIVTVLSEGVSNESPSSFSYLFTQPLMQGSHVPVSYPQLCLWVHYWRPQLQSFHAAFVLKRHVVCRSATKIR